MVPEETTALDVAVAEKVMGKTVVYREDWQTQHLAWEGEGYALSVFWAPGGRNYESLGEERGGSLKVRLIPAYSTRVEDAWLVVERLADLGHALHVKADGLRPPERRYNAIGACHDHNKHLGIESGNAAEVICRAALRMVGAEEDR